MSRLICGFSKTARIRTIFRAGCDSVLSSQDIILLRHTGEQLHGRKARGRHTGHLVA